MNISEKNLTIPLSEITVPETYIRDRVDNNTVNKWIERIKSQMTDGITADAAWFLPPVMLLKLTKPITVTYTSTDKAKVSRTVNYRIVEGVKRYLTAIGVGKTRLTADIVTGLTPTEEYLEQFSQNATHGEPFTREGTYAFIKVASITFKATPAELARRTGYTEASISRIIAGKQGLAAEAVSASRKKAAKGRKGGKGKGGKGAGGHRKTGWNPGEFFVNARAMARECAAKNKVLNEYLAEHDNAWPHAQALIDALGALRTT
jgi:hypothetical protein